MKKFFICFLILFLSACGEKAEEKAFLDKNVKSFLEYNEIGGVTPKMQLSNVLTKMTDVKMHIQDYEFSKICQHNVEYLVENMDIVLNMYKTFSLEDAGEQDYVSSNEAEKALKETLEYDSCRKLMTVVDKRKYIVEQSKLLLEEISKEHSNFDFIKRYIAEGANVNVRNKYGFTPLMEIAQSDNPQSLDIVKLLVENGADVNAKDKQGWTALMGISKFENPQALEIAKLLIENGADINAKSDNNRTALMWSTCSENPQAFNIVKLLVEKGANINTKDIEGDTALKFATESNNSDALDIVKFLIEKGADTTGKIGQNALRAIAWSKNPKALDIAKLLLENGVDVHDNNILEWFAGSSNPQKIEIIKLLITYSKVEIKRYVYILQWFNQKQQAMAVIKWLIERDSVIDAKDEFGNTELIYASRYATRYQYPEITEIIRLLLQKGANVNIGGQNNKTALMYASENGNPQALDIVKLLLEEGADINAKDNERHTALMLASESENPQKEEIIKFLKEHGAK